MCQPDRLPDFFEDIQESAEKAFGKAASQLIEGLIYAKKPAHLKN